MHVPVTKLKLEPLKLPSSRKEDDQSMKSSRTQVVASFTKGHSVPNLFKKNDQTAREQKFSEYFAEKHINTLRTLKQFYDHQMNTTFLGIKQSEHYAFMNKTHSSFRPYQTTSTGFNNTSFQPFHKQSKANTLPFLSSDNLNNEFAAGATQKLKDEYLLNLSSLINYEERISLIMGELHHNRNRINYYHDYWNLSFDIQLEGITKYLKNEDVTNTFEKLFTLENVSFALCHYFSENAQKRKNRFPYWEESFVAKLRGLVNFAHQNLLMIYEMMVSKLKMEENTWIRKLKEIVYRKKISDLKNKNIILIKRNNEIIYQVLKKINRVYNIGDEGNLILRGVERRLVKIKSTTRTKN